MVASKDYDESYKTPVLTAGKTFILGFTNEVEGIFKEHLPVIIFDDFTTAFKFVNFSFKAKSSAMKILKPKKGVNIYFVYEVMRNIEYKVNSHERHWISKYSNIEVPTPIDEEQNKIAKFLSNIDKKINAVEMQIEKTEDYKNGLVQKLFI